MGTVGVTTTKEVVLVIPMPAVSPLEPAVVKAVGDVAKDPSVNVNPACGAHPTASADPAAVVALLMVIEVAVPADVVTVGTPSADAAGIPVPFNAALAGTPVKSPLRVVAPEPNVTLATSPPGLVTGVKLLV